MDVDHFDPRKKTHKIQQYHNLFLADKRCNSRKSDHWPSADAFAAGCRFLNCCEELDYGESIFEDPETHELVGTTPAAKYHILMIDLNAPELIEARSERARFILMKIQVDTMSADDPQIRKAISLMEPYFKEYIPTIPPPPKTPCPG